MSVNGSDHGGDTGVGSPPADLEDFLDLLNELKADGCNLLIVGDARRELFTRASASLLGDSSARRYRVLAITDASRQSVAERLPEDGRTPWPLAETTKLVNHVVPPRSLATSDADPWSTVAAIPEANVADPQLAGLRSEFVASMESFAREATGLDPAALRVGVDSLGPLLDHYDESVVRRFLRTVTERATEHDAMAHYVLTEPYDSDRVRSLTSEFDAVIEVRSVDPAANGHDAEERWHVPDRDLTMDWLPL